VSWHSAVHERRVSVGARVMEARMRVGTKAIPAPQRRGENAKKISGTCDQELEKTFFGFGTLTYEERVFYVFISELRRGCSFV
jgi:hypothetical protein